MSEREVEELYRRAGAKADDVWRPSKVAIRLLGRGNVVRVRGMFELGALVDGKRIEVREGLSPEITEWVIGHELGHWVRETKHHDAAEELVCDYIGAAIQMRKRVFVKRAREVKGDLRQLAFDFAVTQTSAALRLGETDGRPIAVVAPHRVYARGALRKAEDELLRDWAEHGHPGIRRALLGDDPRRTLLVHSA